MTLALRELRKTFRGREILAPLSLELETGEFVCVLGPSGCGKSTLLRVIAGLENADAGSSLSNDFAHETGFVFQEPELMPWRSVEENVRLPLELLGRSDTGQVRELIALVGLAGFETYRPAELSGGMRMRVSLARALVGEPRLLLLDEPFAALDEPVREQLEDELQRIARQKNLTVIFVTHSVAEAVYIGTRVLVFSARPGRILLDRRLELPSLRDSSLRASPAYAEELRLVGQVLRSGYQEDLAL